MLAPLEPELGYNRVKLWVGTFGLDISYYIKLEILNCNFSNYVRMPVMLASLIMMTYGVVRLLKSGLFLPFGEHAEIIHYILGIGIMFGSNMVVVFNG